jgi:lysophospholipase L1-like esterase
MRPLDEDSAATHVRYLALGDSYTIGHGVETAQRWPEILKTRLEARGVAFDTLQIIARTGWTTGNLQAAMQSAQLDSGYTLVSLLIGVNNEYQYRPLDEYRLQFRSLLNQAIALAAGKTEHVFVVSIPDYGYTPYGQANQTVISGRIDAFNAVNREISAELGVRYFDITPSSRQWRPDFVAPDGLHPSGTQYAAWVDVIEPGVWEILHP